MAPASSSSNCTRAPADAAFLSHAPAERDGARTAAIATADPAASTHGCWGAPGQRARRGRAGPGGDVAQRRCACAPPRRISRACIHLHSRGDLHHENGPAPEPPTRPLQTAWGKEDHATPTRHATRRPLAHFPRRASKQNMVCPQKRNTGGFSHQQRDAPQPQTGPGSIRVETAQRPNHHSDSASLCSSVLEVWFVVICCKHRVSFHNSDAVAERSWSSILGFCLFLRFVANILSAPTIVILLPNGYVPASWSSVLL